MLLDKLKRCAPSRIVNITAISQKKGKINFEDLNSDTNYDAGKAYDQSQLAIMLFTKELAKRLDGKLKNNQIFYQCTCHRRI